MRRFLLLMLCNLVLAAGAEEFRCSGVYDLKLSGDAAWHHHRLVVSSASASGVSGTLDLDWGLGPQARGPRPDEKVHHLPFEGTWDKSGAFHFSLTVGTETPARYEFELFPLDNRDLVGVVRVTPLSSGVSAGPWKMGVLAAPVSNP